MDQNVKSGKSPGGNPVSRNSNASKGCTTNLGVKNSCNVNTRNQWPYSPVKGTGNNDPNLHLKFINVDKFVALTRNLL